MCRYKFTGEIARKVRIKKKKKLFDLYIEKRNEEGIREIENEITRLEEEINKLKSVQK